MEENGNGTSSNIHEDARWMKEDNEVDIEGNDLREPRIVRTKGCTSKGSRKRSYHCSVCRDEGHNRTSCPVHNHNLNSTQLSTEDCFTLGDEVNDEIYNGNFYMQTDVDYGMGYGNSDLQEDTCVDLSSDDM